MTESPEIRRPAVDAATLTPIVRQALRSPAAVVTEWAGHHLPLNGAPMTDSIHRFHGTARTGEGPRTWSLFLKILKRTDFHYLIERLGPEHADSFDPDSVWKNEALFLRSGILKGWNGGLVPVRCFRAHEVGEDAVWLWLEDLSEPAGTSWRLDRYVVAARHIGELNGAHLERGASLPWLLRSFARGHLANITPPEGWESLMSSRGWSHPALRAVFPEGTSDRIFKLLQGSRALLDWLSRQPQTFSHQDPDRRNLFARRLPGGRDQTVAIDWQMVGLSAVGEDLGHFVFGTLYFFDMEASRAREFHESAVDGYIDGLRSVGCRDDEGGVRLTQALRGLTKLVMVPANVHWYADSGTLDNLISSRAALHGYSTEETLERWAEAVRYILDVVEGAAREVV